MKKNHRLIILIIFGLLLSLVFVSSGCTKSEPPPPSIVSKPEGPLVFQPKLNWANDKVTHQGTGFLVQTPAGEIAGITSAHYINFDGPALSSVTWLEIPGYDPLITFEYSLAHRKNPGTPG